MKRRPEEWLKIVKMHVDDGVPMTKLAKKYKFDVAKLKYKVKVYLMHGESPYTDEQEKRVYTREEKLAAIEAVMSGRKSCRQVALELAVPNPHTVQDWVALYKRRGEDAIQVSRGRKKYMLHEDRQAYLADKELRERCRHLEEENEFLKKSLALALKKDRRLRKRLESSKSSGAESS